MAHYLMIKLRSFSWLIGILPALLILGYIVSYMYDMSGVVYVLGVNDKMVRAGLETQNIKEVTDFEEQASGLYRVTIDGSGVSDFEVSYGDMVYSLSIINESWFRMTTPERLLYVSGSDLFKVSVNDDGTYKISADDLSFNVNQGDLVCTVFVSEDGDYLVEYHDDKSTSVLRDKLMNVSILMKDGDNYKLHVDTSYNLEMSSMECNFTTVLPTENVYYDTERGVCLRNLTSDFALNFIRGSKLILVLVCILVWFLLLWYVRAKGLLEGVSGKAQLIVNGIALVGIGLMFVMTFVYFG